MVCRKKAYSQEGCAQAKELKEGGIQTKESYIIGANAKKPHVPAANANKSCAAASRTHSVRLQGNVDSALMDAEGIFVDDEAVLVDIELRADADAQEADRKNQSEEPSVEPILYADTAAAQIPVDDKANVKLNIVYVNENPRIEVNEYFPSMEDFRMALRQHGVKKGFQVHKIKTDKTRYRAECKAEGCPWRIVARKLQDLPTVVVLL